MPPSALARGPQCEPRSPGIHGAHGRGSRAGGRTDSPRVQRRCTQPPHALLNTISRHKTSPRVPPQGPITMNKNTSVRSSEAAHQGLVDARWPHDHARHTHIARPKSGCTHARSAGIKLYFKVEIKVTSDEVPCTDKQTVRAYSCCVNVPAPRRSLQFRTHLQSDLSRISVGSQPDLSRISVEHELRDGVLPEVDAQRKHLPRLGGG